MRQDDKTTTRTMTMEEHNAILRDQLSGMVERLAAMEMKLDLEVANRDSLVAAEVERLMPSMATPTRGTTGWARPGACCAAALPT